MSDKVYNAQPLNRIQSEIEKILTKIKIAFGKINPQIVAVSRNIESVRVKKFEATLVFVNFSKSFDYLHWGKMEQILLVYSLPKGKNTALMMLYQKLTQ